jgi:asparaginyl-tRNA synthetase
MVQHALKNRKEELQALGADIQKLEKVAPPFRKITYTRAVEILADNGFPVAWGDDLKARHEAFLSEHAGSVPLFLTHFPVEIKFFNMRRNAENPRVVNSADLILPHAGEAVGAAERHHEHDEIYARLAQSEMLKKLAARGGGIHDFQWYLDVLRSGRQVPHAGCGIGLNRVTQFVLGAGDCRLTTVYPQNRETVL